MDAFGLEDVTCEPVHQFVNEVVAVSSAAGRRYALKLYREGLRSEAEIRWEVDLLGHLVAHGAPVVAPISGREGVVQHLEVGDAPRLAVLVEWAPGAKPQPNPATYRLLGRAAASIHAAADSFASDLPREAQTLEVLIDRPLRQLRPLLQRVGRWKAVEALAQRLGRHIAELPLDWGICHNDLTLDNVHRNGETLTVFDLDSAAPGWRAAEGQGVFSWSVRSRPELWRSWLAGYREVRDMDSVAEASAPWFAVVSELGNTAWKLGLTPTSVGPLMAIADLAAVADGWLAWEQQQLVPRRDPKSSAT